MKRRLLLIILLTLAFNAGNAQTKNFIDQPYIEVSGSADTLVTPNEIFIRIQLSEKDTRDRVPIEELEQRMVDALKGLGFIIEKDLVTVDMASNFKAYLLKSKDVMKSKMYMLKVSDAVTASKVFIKLEELDISNASIDRVDHSDMESLKNTMRANAMFDAKNRATAMVRALNQSIGPAIHVIEVETNYTNQLQGRVQGVVIRGVTSLKNDDKELSKIEFEKIKVNASITAKFILK